MWRQQRQQRKSRSVFDHGGSCRHGTGGTDAILDRRDAATGIHCGDAACIDDSRCAHVVFERRLIRGRQRVSGARATAIARAFVRMRFAHS